MIIDPRHPFSNQFFPVGNVTLIEELVQHGIERTFLRNDPAAADALRFLNKLVTVHILPRQQRQDNKRHDPAAEVIL